MNHTQHATTASEDQHEAVKFSALSGATQRPPGETAHVRKVHMHMIAQARLYSYVFAWIRVEEMLQELVDVALIVHVFLPHTYVHMCIRTHVHMYTRTHVHMIYMRVIWVWPLTYNWWMNRVHQDRRQTSNRHVLRAKRIDVASARGFWERHKRGAEFVCGACAPRVVRQDCVALNICASRPPHPELCICVLLISDRAVCLCNHIWIPFGDHPIKLERYRED